MLHLFPVISYIAALHRKHLLLLIRIYSLDKTINEIIDSSIQLY